MTPTSAAVPSRRQVLQLYRALLTYGRTLELTDPEYYYARVRREFEAHKNLTSESERVFYFQKGLSFLSKLRLL